MEMKEARKEKDEKRHHQPSKIEERERESSDRQTDGTLRQTTSSKFLCINVIEDITTWSQRTARLLVTIESIWPLSVEFHWLLVLAFFPTGGHVRPTPFFLSINLIRSTVQSSIIKHTTSSSSISP
jgi:hypothetical protein